MPGIYPFRRYLSVAELCPSLAAAVEDDHATI